VSPQAWLSTNTTTPLWVFFVVAIPSLFVTIFIVILLKWMEKRDSWLRRLVERVFWKTSRSLPSLNYEDAIDLKFDPALLV
jgi:hypothetical protein